MTVLGCIEVEMLVESRDKQLSKDCFQGVKTIRNSD